MVSVIDQDGDGDINFNEFVWLMTRLVILNQIFDWINLFCAIESFMILR